MYGVGSAYVSYRDLELIDGLRAFGVSREVSFQHPWRAETWHFSVPVRQTVHATNRLSFESYTAWLDPPEMTTAHCEDKNLNAKIV